MAILLFVGKSFGKFFLMPRVAGQAVCKPGLRTFGERIFVHYGSGLSIGVVFYFRNVDFGMSECSIVGVRPLDDAANCKLIIRLDNKGLNLTISGFVVFFLFHQRRSGIPVG